MKKYKLAVLFTSMVMINAVSAATAVNLQKQSATVLQKYITQAAPGGVQLKTIRTDTDFNKTTHTRLQQTYSGYPVWGATAIVHTPQRTNNNFQTLAVGIGNHPTLNGKVYDGLERDLFSTRSAVNDVQKAKALSLAKATFASNTKQLVNNAKEESIKTIIFVNAKNEARYAFLTSFYVDDGETGAHRPMMIIDAVTLEIYRSWDGVMHANHHLAKNAVNLQTINAGGIGGNEKSGENIYDGHGSNLPTLSMESLEQEIEILPNQKVKVTFCYLVNEDVVVQDVPYDNQVVGTACLPFNKVPWLSLDKNGTRWKADEANGAFSPSLDAFYTGNVVQKLYRDWYGIPALVEEDRITPMQLIMRVHYGRKFDNAFWDGQQMTFGDGGNMFYPLVSLDIAAHEVSHGFTQQHSDIDGYKNQMAALHEAFSDMASVSAVYYTTGKAVWEVGRSVMKGDGALRYIDKPTRDGMSIDNIGDYNDNVEPHAAAGVFNKAFYLIATSKGWDVRKAFNIMVKANMNYWSPSTDTFTDAACGVLQATQDYQYKTDAVKVAFSKVGIELDNC